METSSKLGRLSTVFSYKIIKIKTQIIDNGTKKLIQPKRVKYLKQCRCFQILGRFKGDFFQDTSADNLHSRAPSNSNKSRSSTLFSPSGFSQHLELEETRDVFQHLELEETRDV